MVASAHPEVIDARWWLIPKGVIESEEASEYGSIDNYGAALYEEDESGSWDAGMITCMTEAGTKDVEEVHQVVKYYSLSSYILKPNSLLTQGFKYNNKAQ